MREGADPQRGKVTGDEWESLGEEPWAGDARSRRVVRGERLGATLYELPPRAAGGPYHFHHGNEEVLVVLRGRPTLRTPTGEEVLEEGAVVHFGLGAESAHTLSNETDEAVRYLMVGGRVSPDAVEYPDTRQVSVMALTTSQAGAPLWDLRTLPEESDAQG